MRTTTTATTTNVERRLDHKNLAEEAPVLMEFVLSNGIYVSEIAVAPAEGGAKVS
jgi:hypothetical protein